MVLIHPTPSESIFLDMRRVTFDQVYGDPVYLHMMYVKKKAAQFRRKGDHFSAALYERMADRDKQKLRAKGWYRMQALYLKRK